MIIIIPLQPYDLLEIGQGPAILVVGILGILLWASVKFKNPMAMMAWSLSVIMLVLSGLVDVGFELVWTAIIICSILVAIGVVVRWTT